MLLPDPGTPVASTSHSISPCQAHSAPPDPVLPPACPQLLPFSLVDTASATLASLFLQTANTFPPGECHCCALCLDHVPSRCLHGFSLTSLGLCSNVKSTNRPSLTTQAKIAPVISWRLITWFCFSSVTLTSTQHLLGFVYIPWLLRLPPPTRVLTP